MVVVLSINDCIIQYTVYIIYHGVHGPELVLNSFFLEKSAGSRLGFSGTWDAVDVSKDREKHAVPIYREILIDYHWLALINIDWHWLTLIEGDVLAEPSNAIDKLGNDPPLM